MPWRFCCLLLLLTGCVSRNYLGPPPTSLFHQTLTELAPEVLTQRLQQEGWQVELLERTRQGQSATNPGEQWNQTIILVRFRAQQDQKDPVVLTPEQSKPILKGVRTDLRKLVQQMGGEVIDTVDGESYRERTIAMSYRIDSLSGLLVGRIGPATDAAEETNNRLELTIREQN